MAEYLGEFPVDTSKTKYANYDRAAWALTYIEMYGQIDGGHHKAWVLDQVARILNGAPVSIVEAKWADGNTEYRFSVGESEAYEAWVLRMRDPDENGEDQYGYDEGRAP